MPSTFDINPVTLDWLRESHPDIDDRLKASRAFHEALAAVTLASRFLTRLLLSDVGALDVLTDLDERPAVHDDGDVDDLVVFKKRELLRIAARDLTRLDSMEEVGARLARLADDVVEHSLRIAEASELTVVGMGKLGGRELNYSSDIDILFVGETDDRLARDVLSIARQCFRVDAALRPEGRDGPLVRTVDSYKKYWAEYAHTWEFQALLKARVIAGPEPMATDWANAARAAVWNRPFGSEQIREAREMKARTEQLLLRDGTADREVKRGWGGIRDIEFAVQLLQLVHGANDEAIRSPTTLTALAELSSGGYIGTDDAVNLADSYRFLRTVEHRLQLVEEEQTHLIPSDRARRDHLATVMGYRGPDALATFDSDLRLNQSLVRSVHERLYFRPLLEAFTAGNLKHGGSLETQLTAFGFTDVDRTRVAVQELTKGLARSSRLMQQMMPLLLDWLSVSPDPDEGLLGLRMLISGFRTPAQVINAFRDSPEVARRLCSLLGTSKLFAQSLARNPELISDLSADDTLLPDEPILQRLRAAMQWRHSGEERHEALLRLTRAEQVRIAAGDVLGIITDARAMKRRTDLAEAVLAISLDDVAPSIPVALIGMGRFGGAELAYASDLDLIVVHDGKTPEEQLEAEAIAQRLLRVVGNPTPGQRLYPLDYGLRPEGKNGVLARSIDSCIEYYANWAETWERQALVRARPVAGDIGIGNKFMAAVDYFVWQRPLTPEAIREIRHLKARMEAERLPRGGDPQYHLKLGRGSLSDVEWTTQLLQLQNCVRTTNTLEALATLESIDAINSQDHQVLEEAWMFCDKARNRWFLVNNGPGDAFPANVQKLAFLARSMETPELRERYRQVTRRARNVVERLFYGQNS